MPIDNPTPVELAAEATARRSYGKLIAFLAARTRDVAGAEDALSEAFATALVHWPVDGVPDNPEAWLLTVARRKMIDAARQRHGQADVAEQLHWMTELSHRDEADEGIPDDRLSLMFACAHPAIDVNVRAPLMLQTTLGFDAVAIASAFLVAPATMGQRLVRAKAKIRQAGIPFHVPDRADMRERLDTVLEAIYAAYAEGWTDPAGTDTRRRNLAEEAIWLGKLVASLLPEEPEGPCALGCTDDRRGRAALVSRERFRLGRPLPTGGRCSVGTPRAATNGARRLGRHRTPLRRLGRAHRFAGRRDQPSHCNRRNARPGGGARRARCLVRRCSARTVSAVLGGARGAAGAHRPVRCG
jgi:RNA polymerase sigma-70 factor (ECF subfamily)